MATAAPSPYATRILKPTAPIASNPIEGAPSPPPMRTPDKGESPILQKAAEAQQEAAQKGRNKHEKAFQVGARKRPEVFADANKHLADGQADMQADLKVSELRLLQMEDQIAAAAPADRDVLVQQYNAAVLEHDANKQLVDSVAAAQIDKTAGRPTRAEAEKKGVALTGVQADIVRRLNDPNLNEEQFQQLSDRLVAVSSNIREMKDLIENKNPGVRRKARRLAQRGAARMFGVKSLADPSGVDTYLDTVHNKSSWWNDMRRTAYRGPGGGDEATAASPLMQRAMIEAANQNMSHEGAVGNLRATINSALEADRNAIYNADAAAKAQAAERAAAAQAPKQAVAEASPATAAGGQVESVVVTPGGNAKQESAQPTQDTKANKSPADVVAEQLTRRNQLLAEFSSIAGGKLTPEQLNQMVDVAMNNSDKDGKPASWGALLQMAMVLMSSLSQAEQARTMSSEANPSKN